MSGVGGIHECDLLWRSGIIQQLFGGSDGGSCSRSSGTCIGVAVGPGRLHLLLVGLALAELFQRSPGLGFAAAEASRCCQ